MRRIALLEERLASIAALTTAPGASVEEVLSRIHELAAQECPVARGGEWQYLDLLRDILSDGDRRSDRTGTGTLSLFGNQMRFDLSEGIPILTTKKLHLRSIVHELLWFLTGDTNVRYLRENGVRIWDEWADENGDLGPVYGSQWRSWPDGSGGCIDQISELVDGLRREPYSRRHMVVAWNPAELRRMALPPCHCLFQFHVSRGRLSCKLYQRSGDVFLGVPFNVASYSLLTIMMARVLGLEPGDFVHTFGDVHLYLDHVEQAREQLSRTPRPFPTMEIVDRGQGILDFAYDDFRLVGYDPHPTIAARVSR